MKRILLIATMALAAMVATSQAADAKANYDQHCAKCHGADGKGDTKMGKKLGAKDYTDAKVQSEMKDDEAFNALKKGLKEKGTDKTLMKAFEELSDAELKDLVAYMRKFKK